MPILWPSNSSGIIKIKWKCLLCTLDNWKWVYQITIWHSKFLIHDTNDEVHYPPEIPRFSCHSGTNAFNSGRLKRSARICNFQELAKKHFDQAWASNRHERNWRRIKPFCHHCFFFFESYILLFFVIKWLKSVPHFELLLYFEISRLKIVQIQQNIPC